ncbi:MAG TPA: thioredoxin-disulfide reductase [Spirochaetota bacterium]|nr:thioredoxin-disulfide reductase [Spirochaetota bacterium]
MANDSHKRVIIIGGGPAGLTAAVYTARARLEPILIEGMDAGGQLMTTSEVENFPGFPDGIMGPELIANMRRQAEKFGTVFVSGHVTGVDLSKRPYTVTVGDQTLTTATLIIATGATARYLDIPSVQRLRGHGISACATCDGFFFRNKKVFLAGGGDSALEEAQFLTQFASSVTVIHRRDEFRASKIMQEYARNNPKISFLMSHVIVDALGEDRLTGLRLRDLTTNEVKEVEADGLFFAIGHDPNTGIFKPFLETDEAGYLKRQPDRTATTIPGVFAAGDVADNYYRQATTAAADGCRAALEVEKFLLSQGEAH